MRRLQDLPPARARLCLGIEHFVRELADLDGTRLITAFSGGVDSTGLLHVLSVLVPRLGLRLEAAHLDHGMRPESPAEAEHARAVCASLGVPFHMERTDVPALARDAATGLEETARAARYAFLDRTRAKTGADWICLGHQLDDLAEDVLMRLVRGAGWPELGGMEAVDADRRILRPMLMTPKAEIVAFCRDIGASWTEDRSNEDMAFLRNRVRHTMLPLFLQENPSFLQAVARTWRLARLDAQLFASLQPGLPCEDGDIVLADDILREAHPALRLRWFKAAVSALGPGQALMENLEALEAAWARGEPGKVVQFPGGKRALVTRAGVRFSAEA
jgi:tRNA(Ile)-lysidine synthase